MEFTLSLTSLFDCDDGTNNISPTLDNGQQKTLKKRLKTLSNFVSNYGLITIKWMDSDCFKGLLLAFSHGIISSICFNSNNEIINIYHEDFLLSTKLASRRVSSIEINTQFILISYIEPYLTHISLEHNFKKNKIYYKFKLKDSCPIKTVNLERCNNRHIKRNLVISNDSAMLWWNTALFSNWPVQGNGFKSPNLIVFDLKSLHIISNETIDGEIIKNDFVEQDPNKIGLLSRPNDSLYHLKYIVFEILDGNKGSEDGPTPVDNNQHNQEAVSRLSVIFSANIPLDKSCLSAEFTKLQDKILLLCDDESVMLFNVEQNVLYSLHSSMPVCYISSSPFDTIFVTCNQYGRLSLYDYAFNNIAFNVQRKNSNDKGYFVQKYCDMINTNSNKMSIKRLEFLSSQMFAVLLVDNKRQDSTAKGDKVASASSSGATFSCSLALVSFPYKITFKRLISEYLHCARYEEALNMLRIINWNCSFDEAYYCLNTIFQYLLKLPLNPELECHIESTLATFLIPCTPIDYKIFEQILPYIRHLAIRFFYHLIRNQSYSKAYQLGIELKSRRLFLLLHEIAKQFGNHELAQSSYIQARNLA